MAITHERKGILYLLAIVAILAVALGAMIDGADARARTKVKTSLTIRERVDIQTDNCEMAGGEISVSYAYEDDGSESATTSCSGGLLDGNVCINEATTMECYQAGRLVPPLRGFDGTRPLVPITEVQVEQPTPATVVPGSIDAGVAPDEVSGDPPASSRDDVPILVLLPLD